MICCSILSKSTNCQILDKSSERQLRVMSLLFAEYLNPCQKALQSWIGHWIFSVSALFLNRMKFSVGWKAARDTAARTQLALHKVTRSRKHSSNRGPITSDCTHCDELRFWYCVFTYGSLHPSAPITQLQKETRQLFTAPNHTARPLSTGN